jgi:hypothetical protein
VSLADQIACRVKMQMMTPVGRLANGILIGAKVMNILRVNQQPCDPPDLVDAGLSREFCGYKVIEAANPDQLAFVINIP